MLDNGNSSNRLIYELISKCRFHALSYRTIRNIRPNARAHGGHYVPVLDIDQHTFDKGPLPAHARFDRMNGAQLVPENTIAVFLLGQNGSAAGESAELRFKRISIRSHIFGNDFDVLLA